jgi:hypothetical protein
MAKGKVECEVCGKEIVEIFKGNKLCPECGKTPKRTKAPEARKNDHDTSILSVLRDVGRSDRRVFIRKNTLCYILLSLVMHPIAYAVMWYSMKVPFLVIPCLYCVIAVIFGVRAIKLMERNGIHRAYIITFAILNFSILLGVSGLAFIVQLLRFTAQHII